MQNMQGEELEEIRGEILALVEKLDLLIAANGETEASGDQVG